MFSRFVLPALAVTSVAVIAPALAEDAAKSGTDHDVPACCRQMAMHMQQAVKEGAAASQGRPSSREEGRPSSREESKTRQQPVTADTDPSGWGG